LADFIVMLGLPGAGKGTQARTIAEILAIPHISSGDIFRENFKQQTELGKLADGFISRGELVPDDITIAMIEVRISQPDCARGAILDGFPRTPAQAEALDHMLAKLGGKVSAVPYINVPQSILVERLSGRWTCREAGHVYHINFSPPKQPGICDVDGSELYQREDDRAETVLKRIQVYLVQTQPLIDYYTHRGLLVEINGDQAIEKVTADLVATLKEKRSVDVR
jgi:adenylate kinase